MTNGDRALIQSTQRFIAHVESADRRDCLKVVVKSDTFKDMKEKLRLVIESQPRKKL